MDRQDRLNSIPIYAGEKHVYDASEEDALLTGRSTNRTTRSRRWTEIGLFAWAAAATIIAVFIASSAQQEKDARFNGHHNEKPSGKRNMIFMVSDGMGPASLELSRSWRQFTDNLSYEDILVLDQHLIGSSRTRSSSSLITDSAAGATAFSCGFKSYNEAISVLPNQTPCGTVLEAAKKAGYVTGLVVTTRITDATPACFGAHASYRQYEDLIAEHLIGQYPLGQTVDLIVGGGRCHFLPNTTEGSCRADNKDIVHLARKAGYDYIDNRKDLDRLASKGNANLPLLALMASGDIPFEIDRRHIPEQYPSQYEMAKFALDTLSAATKNSDKGFFIMIEGSRIDHAGHLNDPAAQVHEVLMHDKTFSAVLDFLESSDEEGVLLSTSDHETGGLSAGKQLGPAYPQYIWYPEALANATHSASYASSLWLRYLSSNTARGRKDLETKLISILQSDLGISNPTSDELDAFFPSQSAIATPPVYLFADMISRRALLGWSTHGHSGVDVNIYASKSPFVEKLRGNHENIEIGRFMAEYLDVDVAAVTRELVEKGVKTRPDEEVVEWSRRVKGQRAYDSVGGVGSDEYHFQG